MEKSSCWCLTVRAFCLRAISKFSNRERLFHLSSFLTRRVQRIAFASSFVENLPNMLEDKHHSYTLKLKTAFPSHSHIIHPFSSATSNNIRSDRWCVSTWEISSRRSGAGNGGRREWTKSTALSSKCTSKPTPESSGSIEVPRGSNHFTKV